MNVRGLSSMKSVVCQEPWIEHMANELIYEVTELMSGIALSCCPLALPGAERLQGMEHFRAEVDGDLDIHMQLWADAPILNQLAENMIGGPPEDQEEVHEYATEYVNVLCGRFLSEICRHMKAKVKFFFPEYQSPPNEARPYPDGGMTALCCSDGTTSGLENMVVFSWVVRSEKQEHKTN